VFIKNEKVYLSTRRGAWLYNRVGPSGWPIDMCRTNPTIATLQKYSPWLMNRLIERELSKKFNHELYSLKPNHDPLRKSFVFASVYVH
jgi:dimethylaniline monooxygenase (N-oxide forming)